jgi:hypothetical protein
MPVLVRCVSLLIIFWQVLCKGCSITLLKVPCPTNCGVVRKNVACGGLSAGVICWPGGDKYTPKYPRYTFLGSSLHTHSLYSIPILFRYVNLPHQLKKGPALRLCMIHVMDISVAHIINVHKEKCHNLSNCPVTFLLIVSGIVTLTWLRDAAEGSKLFFEEGM